MTLDLPNAVPCYRCERFIASGFAPVMLTALAGYRETFDLLMGLHEPPVPFSQTSHQIAPAWLSDQSDCRVWDADRCWPWRTRAEDSQFRLMPWHFSDRLLSCRATGGDGLRMAWEKCGRDGTGCLGHGGWPGWDAKRGEFTDEENICGECGGRGGWWKAVRT